MPKEYNKIYLKYKKLWQDFTNKFNELAKLNNRFSPSRESTQYSNLKNQVIILEKEFEEVEKIILLKLKNLDKISKDIQEINDFHVKIQDVFTKINKITIDLNDHCSKLLEIYNWLEKTSKDIDNNFKQIHQELAKNETTKYFYAKEQQVFGENAFFSKHSGINKR
ncbi:hypothetical protein [Spiroplasma mirum]|uniref:hypothetical protein n=1 Tax=Spiroplasma mirum TaxID=2144 RepID=UPI0003DFC890|nr:MULTISPECIES: hypothetical protein [Spiroplasma]AHF60907.1 hypothetical protein SMM_0474 [Spiroplasma mirum ATCC 29335]AKM53022.1 hypothetical protein SATRI_v1c05340 [Spiroplasma atrichopogonis]